MKDSNCLRDLKVPDDYQPETTYTATFEGGLMDGVTEQMVMVDGQVPDELRFSQRDWQDRAKPGDEQVPMTDSDWTAYERISLVGTRAAFKEVKGE